MDVPTLGIMLVPPLPLPWSRNRVVWHQQQQNCLHPIDEWTIALFKREFQLDNKERVRHLTAGMEGLVIRGMSDNSGADGGQPSVSRTGFGRNMTIKSCLQANVALPPVSAIGIARPVEYGLSNEERGSLLASR